MTRSRPIHRKLTLMMLLTSGIILLLTCAAFTAYEYVAFRRGSLDQVRTLARVIATNSTAALAFRNREDAEEVLAALKNEPHIDAAALYDEEGRLFARYPRTAADAGFPVTAGAASYAFDGGSLSGFEPVSEHTDQPLGSLYIRSDMGALYERLAQYGLIAALVFGASLLLAYLLSRIFQGQISRPILSLTATARAISERADYSVRAPMMGEGEFRVLNTAFNSMLARIGEQNSALRENEERLRGVMNASTSAVVLMDADGLIIEWSTCAERIFGWTRAEAIGKDLGETVVPQRYRQAHRDGLRRYVAGGEGRIVNQAVEMWALRRDGALFPVEISISVLRASGAVMFCGFITDITERAEARARVQTQLARLDLLQRTTRAIGERQDLASIFQVIIRNLEDNLPIDFGCICLCDAAAEQLVVTSIGAKSSILAHALGLATQSQIPINENGLTACMNGRLVHEPDLGALDFPFARQLVRAGIRSLVAAPLVVESKVFGVLIAGRSRVEFSSADCEFLRQLSEHVALAAHQVQLYTALQGAYEELRHSQQTLLQQERLRALGQMASGIAHDINNAISPVALYTESLLEREPNLSPRTREYLTTIQRSIDDVAQTVARMREFYRQRDQKATLVAVNLNPAVQQVLNLTQARWRDVPQERGIVITVRTELAPDLPRIMGTESDIRDALTNLVFNAVDAMPGGGTLTLRTRVIRATAEAGERVELAVIDTGSGMDEDTRRRCLEPFFTTKGERGTGMGLAMVYGMVKRHNAQIEIDSEPGRGTTMRVLFEVAQADAAPAAAQPAIVAPSRSLRLLVIDDDPLLTRSLSEILSADGHDVTTADGGPAGVATFETACSEGRLFDLVLTDLGMPYVDGRAVAASVKKLAPHTPVLLLTGWGQRLATEQSIPAGVDRVLSKPPGLQELRRALTELTENTEATAVRDAFNCDPPQSGPDA